MSVTVQCDGSVRGVHVVDASTKRAQQWCIVCGAPVHSIEAERQAEAVINRQRVMELGLGPNMEPIEDDIPI